MALQVAQFVALRAAVTSTSSECAGYLAGVIVEAIVIAVLGVVALALLCLILKRRQQGYQAIDAINNKY